MDGLVGALLSGSLESVLFGGGGDGLLSRRTSILTAPSDSDAARPAEESLEEGLEASSADEDGYEAEQPPRTSPVTRTGYGAESGSLHAVEGPSRREWLAAST